MAFILAIARSTAATAAARSARNVLSHPEVDAAVFETARGGVLREGLAYDAARLPSLPISAPAIIWV
jgi:cyanophycin synthetase